MIKTSFDLIVGCTVPASAGSPSYPGEFELRSVVVAHFQDDTPGFGAATLFLLFLTVFTTALTSPISMPN